MMGYVRGRALPINERMYFGLDKKAHALVSFFAARRNMAGAP